MRKTALLLGLTTLCSSASVAFELGGGWSSSEESSDEDDNVVRLTKDNFYEETAGKRVFLDFYDPMCAHCLFMAEDWSTLAEEYGDDEKILIGKMDCTKATNRPLCLELGIKGYPTLFYGDVTDLKEYRGQRDLEDFKTIVDKYLSKPLCGAGHPDLCEPEKRKQIEDLIALGWTNLNEKIEVLERRMEELEKEKDDKVKTLRKTYSSAMTHKDMEKKEFSKMSNMVLMKKILKMKEVEESQWSGDEL